MKQMVLSLATGLCVAFCSLAEANGVAVSAAWQVGLENERGSVKVGKWADFVLADNDVFKCPVTDIRKTKVVSTWFEGSKVYQA